MITISLCMIIKNEEAVLKRCLESVKDAADEIIIVDTGSEDNTKNIAYEYTDKVYDFEWINDFSAARNFAYSKAEMDYQMWLDADDVVPKEELDKLLKLKASLDADADIVTMKYHTHFDVNGIPLLTSTRERLTKRIRNYRWQEPVHECIPLVGKIHNSDITIHHKKMGADAHSTRNLDIYTELEKNGMLITPRRQYYFARELKDHGMYAKASQYFQKFLDGGKGWFEDNIASCYNLAICYQRMNQREKMLPALLKSFEYDSPRAEICCQIGYFYKSDENYKIALKWFDLASKLTIPADSFGFILRDYWGYIPNIEACVCAYQLGDYEQAQEYNEKAFAIKPDDKAVLANKKFFEETLNKDNNV